MPSPTLRAPVDLVLHLGMPKAGTSSVQALLHRNRDRLAARGTLYPRTPGPTRHVRLGLYLRSDEELAGWRTWHRQRTDDPATFRRRFVRRLVAEIDEAGVDHVVLSDEALYGCGTPGLERLRALTDDLARSLRLVVYLRRQDDQLVSRYQQEVKVGETRTLEEYAADASAGYYDYRARLARWERHLAPDRLVVRPFVPEAWADRSLAQDFLQAAGVRARAEDLEPVEVRNESLGAEAVELLRLLNLCRREAGVDRVEVDNRALVERLASAAPGPLLTLPDRTLDAFMDRWAESNAALDRDLLGGREPLFAASRRSAGTVTDQRLDPARVEDLLPLLDLPDELAERLRRVARRAAGTATP